MSIENQASVYHWINTTFPGTDPDSPRKSIRLLEEVVELCLASGATQAEIETAVASPSSVKLRRKFEPDKIPAEAADVLIVLYGVAGMRGIDLGEAVDAKMLINRSRRWKAMGDGTGYHIKEPKGDATS